MIIIMIVTVITTTTTGSSTPRLCWPQQPSKKENHSIVNPRGVRGCTSDRKALWTALKVSFSGQVRGRSTEKSNEPLSTIS